MATNRPGIVSFLFTDLVNSTQLLEELGDDKTQALLRLHLQMLRDAVSAFGGREVKSLGDGLMSAFASAVDSLDCAISMQQSVARYNALGGETMLVRIGLNVGEPIMTETDYFGAAVVVARRLCDAAEAGQILASNLLRSLVGSRGGFSFRDFGTLSLKGLSQPLPASEVLWESLAESRHQPAALRASVATTFVGRSAEIEKLRQAWARARSGSREVVMLGGEPGIGKTTLAAEILRTGHREGARVLAGRCDPEAIVPYQPFVGLISDFLAQAPPSELRSMTQGIAAELVRLVPRLRDIVLSLDVPAPADAETERYRLFEAVATLLGRLAAGGPTMILFDDLHWADRPSILMLRHVLQRPEQAALLLLGTYRDTDVDAGHPLEGVLGDLARQGGGFLKLSLSGLGEDDIIKLLDASDDGGDGLRLARMLTQETEGNPLFVTELLQSLAEAGTVTRTDAGWIAGATLEGVVVPEGVRDVIISRLNRLSPETAAALRIAAVAGQDYDLEVIGPLTDASGEGLLDAMDEAVASRLVAESGYGRYSFSHALVREVLYEDQSRARRMRLHRRLGETIEALHADVLDERLAELAHHFLMAGMAGDIEKAVEYARRAADRSMAMLAYEEAVADLERALAIVEETDVLDLAARAELWLSLADARLRAGDLAGCRAAAVSAANDARAGGVPALIARGAILHTSLSAVGSEDQTSEALCQEALAAVTDNPRLTAEVLAQLALYRTLSLNQGAAAGDLAEEAVDVARQSGDRATLAQALLVRAETLMSSPEVDRQVALADELLSVVPPNDLRSLGLGHRVRALALLKSGAVEDFRGEVDLVSTIGTEGRLWMLSAYAAQWRTLIALFEGRFAEAATMAGEMLKISHGDPNFRAAFAAQMLALTRDRGDIASVRDMVRGALAQNPGIVGFRTASALADADLGDLDSARSSLTDMTADGLAGVPRDAAWMGMLSSLSEVSAVLRDEVSAAVLRDLFRPYSGQLVTVAWGVRVAGAVDRYLGMLSAVLGDGETATASFDSALLLESGIGAAPLVARTKAWYGRALSWSPEATQRARAQPLLREALEAASNLGMAALVAQVEAVLAA